MVDHEMCNNCRREIPEQNYRMHTLHCARNIALCPDCDEPIPRGELEEHREEMHAKQDCTMCDQKIEACKMDQHQKGDCPGKTTLCKYCATHVEQGNLVEHENYCGSRTEKCEKCGEFIMLKNFELHLNSNHGFLKLNDEPGPKASWERSTVKSSAATTSTSSYTSSYTPYTSRFSKPLEEPAPSTPSERSKFTATELFNNQDLYSSRRYSSKDTSLSALHKSSSSSVVSSLHKSTSNSIVNRALNGEPRQGLMPSKSTSVVPSKTEASSSESGEKLPCEFCEAMVPMYKLLSHQAECVNPSNVRSGGDTSERRDSSSSYRAYSSLRTSSSAVLRDSTFARENSVSRSASLNQGSGTVNKYLRQSSVETPVETPTSSLSRYSSSGNNAGSEPSSSRKISPTSGGIVNRFLASPEPNNKSYDMSDSPPTYEKSSSIYMGRSSYLKKDTNNGYKEKKEETKSYSASKSTAAPGMYENDNDREGLRQMLSGLRRDPMDVEDDPDNNDGSFFPCEFCGDPYPSEFIMRHQMSCDLNPRPVASGSGFDYNQIKSSIARNLGIEAPAATSRYTEPDDQRQSSRLSRSNSVVDKSYSRTGRASSVSRTSSFADRSYGTRTNLARQSSFKIADYTSAARRSSVFDGYAGYSIYSSISEGLDQITYGGRTSRRNSVTEMTYSFSRRGSVSAGTSGAGAPDYPLPALMAALDATKASHDDTRKEKQSSTATANDHINGQAAAYLSSINGYSRQNSSNDSPRAIDSPFGAVNGHHLDLQRSDSKNMARRVSTVKHSQSGHKLERRVSFHNRDQIIDSEVQYDENGQPIAKPEKPKRKKERTEEEKQARREKKERKEKKRMERGQSKDRKTKTEERIRNKEHPSGDALVEQVSAKLQDIERQQNRESPLASLPASSLIPGMQHQASNPANHASFQQSTSNANPSNGHLSIQDSDNQLTVKPEEDLIRFASTEQLVNHESRDAVTLREHDDTGSKLGSKRNSLDNKSVQSLAKDLAAECAKAYELMESSLTKLTNDFSIGPFGLTPKNKKKYRAPQPPPLK